MKSQAQRKILKLKDNFHKNQVHIYISRLKDWKEIFLSVKIRRKTNAKNCKNNVKTKLYLEKGSLTMTQI